MIKPPPVKKKLVLDVPSEPAQTKPLTKQADGALAPLNFKVSPEFKRKFKAYAALNDEAMVDILVRAISREMERNG